MGDRLPQILIGSSTEGLLVARAIQEQLEYEARVHVWTDGVMRLSLTTIESLTAKLATSDFAILVITPDDLTIRRGGEVVSARDNVVLELGMCVGSLGKDRTFVVAPRDVLGLHLPTDLAGFEPARYNYQETLANPLSGVASAVNQIRRELARAAETSVRVSHLGMFSDLARLTKAQLVTATEVEVCFIHSRRWRENNKSELLAAANNGARFKVYLPDPADREMFGVMCSHFDDAEFIPALVAEGYAFWATLKEQYQDQVEVYTLTSYPVYSYYRIDDEVLVALYQNSTRRTDVPAFVTLTTGALWDFISGDMECVVGQRSALTLDDLSLRSRTITIEPATANPGKPRFGFRRR